MNLAVPVIVFAGVAGYMKLRKRRCAECHRRVRVAGMVGACCKACAHGHHKCESEMTEEEIAAYREQAVAAMRRNRRLGKRRRY